MAKTIDRLITLHFQDLNKAHLTEFKHITVLDAYATLDDEGVFIVSAFTPKEAKKLGQALIDFAKGKLDTEDSVAEGEMTEDEEIDL